MEDHIGPAKREMGEHPRRSDWTADGSGVPMTSAENGWRKDPLVAAVSEDQEAADGVSASEQTAISNDAPTGEAGRFVRLEGSLPELEQRTRQSVEATADHGPAVQAQMSAPGEDERTSEHDGFHLWVERDEGLAVIGEPFHAGMPHPSAAAQADAATNPTGQEVGLDTPADHVGRSPVEHKQPGGSEGLYKLNGHGRPSQALWKNLEIAPNEQQVSGTDYDGDGVPNGTDPFVTDATNGSTFLLSPGSSLLLDFAALGFGSQAPLTPYEAGFTGLMTVPGSTTNTFEPVPTGVTITAAGLALPAVPGGDFYKATNKLQHGYQVGLDVGDVPAFTAGTVIANPFAGSVPTNYQAQGLQIGTGNQDSYIKLALIANGGSGGIEVMWENAGAVAFRKVYGLDLPNGLSIGDVGTIELNINVDRSGGAPVVLPGWKIYDQSGTLIDNQSDDVQQGFSVSGAIANAIAGTHSIAGTASGLAVGLYATSSKTDSFEAVWQKLTVDAADPFPQPNNRDGDGLLNGTDPFALDATNGKGFLLSETTPLLLDFSALGATSTSPLTPYQVGLTGLMTVPGTTSNGFNTAPPGVTVNADGLTVAAVPGGDFYKAANKLQHGYQVGLDVSGVMAFVAGTVLDNPFHGSVPTNYQAQGFQIGTGNQDGYIKLALVANGGAGGIEVLWENEGAVAFRQVYGLDLPTGVSISDVTEVELGLEVDGSTGEVLVTPQWKVIGPGGLAQEESVIDDHQDDVQQGFAVTGAVADAITGAYTIGGIASGLAVGLYATSNKATSFEANWHELTVRETGPSIVPPDYLFSQINVTGTEGLVAPTSLQFGPDGRLYVAERFGGVWSYEVEQVGSNYQVTDAQHIDLVKNIPNHDDVGNLTDIVGRQVTGLLVAGTAEAPILYVSSSNPVVGGGPSGLDKNLDTNSGMLSRLTWEGDHWEKVDLVRGLPRSEENHSVNGMTIDGDTLYLTIGGNTNAGSPSDKFAYLTEYAYAAAVLTVDLGALDTMPVQGTGTAHPWVYDLPTLDDPTRANVGGDDVNGVFGGNDGRNQARITADSPVQVYATGYRNAYDIVQTSQGKLFVVDNGANSTWGGVPLLDSNGEATNQPNPNVNGIAKDSLHLVTQGAYGGHPNPIRGNPDGAGLYLGNDGVNGWTNSAGLPVDWPPVDPALAFPEDNIFRNAVTDSEGRPTAVGDGSLWAFNASTNGLTEYTASAFEGFLQGDLVAASYDGRLAFIHMNEAGTAVDDVTYSQVLLGNTVPLDVTARGDGDSFAGTIWVANIASSKITVFRPADPGDVVFDVGGDLDKDGIADVTDLFSRDPQNGMATIVAAGGSIVLDFARDPGNPPPLFDVSYFGVGFTGIMSDGKTAPDDLYESSNIIAGGANPIFQIDAVSAGEAHGGSNTQENGFQFGVAFAAAAHGARITTVMDNPFDTTTPGNYQSQGMFIGTGSQSDYVSITASAISGGSVEVKHESGDGVKYKQVYAIPDLYTTNEIELNFDVNLDTGMVRPLWSYTKNGQTFSGAGTALQTQGDTLAAILGDFSQDRDMPGTTGEIDSGLAIGLISTSVGPAPEFTAAWAELSVEGLASAPAMPVADSLAAPVAALGEINLPLYHDSDWAMI